MNKQVKAGSTDGMPETGVTSANRRPHLGSGSASESALDPATISGTAHLWYDLGAMDATGTVTDSSGNGRNGTMPGPQK